MPLHLSHICVPFILERTYRTDRSPVTAATVAKEQSEENGIGQSKENGIGHSAFLLIMALACIGWDRIALWPFATVVWRDR